MGHWLKLNKNKVNNSFTKITSNLRVGTRTGTVKICSEPGTGTQAKWQDSATLLYTAPKELIVSA
jgi:hypothetical protein